MILYHHCSVEEWYDHRSVSAWETSQGLQCSLDPCCVYIIVTLAWCSSPYTVYMLMHYNIHNVLQAMIIMYLLIAAILPQVNFHIP